MPPRPLPWDQSPKMRAPWQLGPRDPPHELFRRQSTTAPLPAEAMSPHRDTITVMMIMGCPCNLRQFAGRRKERNGMLTLQKSKKDHQMHLRCDNQHGWKAPEQIALAPPPQSAQHVTPAALALPRLHPAGSYSAICDSSIPTVAAYLGRRLLLVVAAPPCRAHRW